MKIDERLYTIHLLLTDNGKEPLNMDDIEEVATYLAYMNGEIKEGKIICKEVKA